MNSNYPMYDQTFFHAVPTDAALRRRKSITYQAWRFMHLNLKMLQVVRRSHPSVTSGR